MLEIFWVYSVKRNILVWGTVQIRKDFGEQNGGEIWIVFDELVDAYAVEELNDTHMALVTEVERVGDISRWLSDDDV